ncbi:uncharacterized protein LOC119673361 [Teleopsis dalmanni]|uniref:uncharacterized protein LOC119673360 n=1 Tax=Teleopsis dalmanni TaxID=139649 RepID=UPI000D32A1BA|nr:uncharacterized protein LOC119673360 [Teleopsis dalmanni]XP_037940553.1 uncharacterized protein LOC119673361 [Teleopsis dalmanni]
MKLLRNSSTYLVIFLILFACCAQDAEGTRRVLRGRRTLTRRYFTGLAIPGWALVLLIAVSELLIGVILYFVLRRFILSKEVEQANTYAPAATHEA